MTSPAIIELIIRYFDAVDEALSRRVTRKSRWEEPALTSQLCDLLDEETQGDEVLRFSFENLKREMSRIDGLVTADFKLETHEYDRAWEHWVTQADLGVVVRMVDHMIPENSWSTAWLMQAKRVYPRRRPGPRVYDESSPFPSWDHRQHERIERLVETVGTPFVRYLLYCARPSQLDDLTRHKLAHLRNSGLSGDIFDYTLGLLLHRELGAQESSLAAGVFVAELDRCPRNLGEVHQRCLRDGCLPLSWFFAAHLDGGRWLGRRHPDGRSARRKGLPEASSAQSDAEAWAEGIVSGDHAAAKRVIGALDQCTEAPGAFGVLPRHTLTVQITAGPSDRDDARIRLKQ